MSGVGTPGEMGKRRQNTGLPRRRYVFCAPCPGGRAGGDLCTVGAAPPALEHVIRVLDLRESQGKTFPSCVLPSAVSRVLRRDPGDINLNAEEYTCRLTMEQLPVGVFPKQSCSHMPGDMVQNTHNKTDDQKGGHHRNK